MSRATNRSPLAPTDPTPAESPTRRRDLRRAGKEVIRHWENLQHRVPAPVLRVLVTLPWLARRMPVPFWVPLTLLLLRQIRKHRAKRAAAEGITTR